MQNMEQKSLHLQEISYDTKRWSLSNMQKILWFQIHKDGCEAQMKKEFALKLSSCAKNVAEMFSNPNREYNTTKEIFELKEITPLSESTAIAIYLKNTGKKAFAFFYLVKDKWVYFFPKESHIVGMAKLSKYHQEIEEHNFKKNFYNGII